MLTRHEEHAALAKAIQTSARTLPADFTNSEARTVMSEMFDGHYESEWIQTLSEKDLRDLLYRLWCVRRAAKDDTGEAYTPESRLADMGDMLDTEAMIESERYITRNPPLVGIAA